MVRIALFVILAVWLIGAEELARPSLVVRPGLWVFFGGYLLLLLALALWARALSRRTLNADFYRSNRRFNRAVHYARHFIPAWLAVGFANDIGWGQLVLGITGKYFDDRLESPALFLGTLPALLTWVGIWWAEYPADHARREQLVTSDVEAGLPVHAPPTFGRTMMMSVRQQLLPVVLPVLLVLALRDLVIYFGGSRLSGGAENLVLLVPGILVYLAAPELMRRLFETRPLEPGPLRTRLEEICRKSNLRYREILLWTTDFSMANAAVIGILPRWRYVLLSDRLLETMSDEHIEAVFAHEMGHIVHRHLTWFVVFFISLTLFAAGPGRWTENWIIAQFPSAFSGDNVRTIWRVGTGAFGFVITLMLFGLLARRFEKQADVHGARMMQDNFGQQPAPTEIPERPRSWVGSTGARVYAGALQRVAFINDIPLSASDFFHPSIEKRLNYIHAIAEDPKRTWRFDQSMRRLYLGMLSGFVALLALVVWFDR